MSKKSILIIGVVLIMVSMTALVLAGPGRGIGHGGGFGCRAGIGPDMRPGGMGPHGYWQGVTMTDEQLADWQVWQEKNYNLHKERIELMVKSGMMTTGEGQLRVQIMEQGHAFHNKYGWPAKDGSFTDEQKADMKKLFDQRLELHKLLLAEGVKNGRLTQAEADERVKWMTDRFEQGLETGFRGPIGGPGGQGRGPGSGRGGAYGLGPHM